MWAQEIYTKAYRFAAEAHLGQTVPGTEISYIMHLSFVCMEVMAALANEPNQDENLAIQCALLHDTIEDTAVSFQQLEATFGTPVAHGVLALTKNKTLPKTEQMTDSLARIQTQPHEIWLVKLADRITNLAPPPPHWTTHKMKQYREEAIAIHDALHPASPYLAKRLQQKIAKYKTYYKANN